MNWNCKHTWKKASINTLWCLLGCSIGDFGTIFYFQTVEHLTTWPGNFGPTLSAAQLPSAHVKVSCVDGAPCICGVFMELGGRSGSGYCHVRDVD